MKAEVSELLDAYISALDERRFDDWIALFTDDAYYGVIRHEDFDKGNNLVTLGEDMPKLRARLEAGREVDRDMKLHFVSAVQTGEDNGAVAASANFFVLRNGTPSLAGRYRLQLVRKDGGLKVQRCMVVLDRDVIDEPIYLPI